MSKQVKLGTRKYGEARDVEEKSVSGEEKDDSGGAKSPSMLDGKRNPMLCGFLEKIRLLLHATIASLASEQQSILR